MAKNVSVVVPGAGEDALKIFDVALHPGATVGEALGLLSLENFVLRTADETQGPLAESDDLYALVHERDQLYAAPKMDVG